MRPELLRVPFGTRNAPDLGELVSLVDIPTILRGEAHGEGTFDRDVAFASYGETHAAMNAKHIAAEDGVLDVDTGEPVTDRSLQRHFERLEAGGIVKEDALQEDLEDLGYA